MIGTQVTVGTTATQILPADNINRKVLFHVVGNAIVYVGAANVTTATGFYIDKASGVIPIDIPPNRVLYGIVTTGTEVVTVLVPEI